MRHDPKSRMRGPQVRFCERRGGATCRAYSTRSSTEGKNAAAPESHPPEVVAQAKRRRFTAEYKQRILAAVDQAKGSSGIGILLRREGLYSSLLSTWRREPDAGVLYPFGKTA